MKKSPQPKKRDKVLELTEDVKRLQADFINFKARAEKERIEAVQNGRERAIIELLPLLDNLERAFQHAPEELAENLWVKGVLGLEKQLMTLMEDFGLEKIETVGQEFDPSSMEAVSHGDGDMVSEELRSGYKLGGRVVRPAMVKVG